MSASRSIANLDLARPTGSARLANGLEVCLLENRQAPVITCALCYRVGARHESDGTYGTAHFLEHMMFKGAARFGPGEIDRHTQRLGGSNNAFTSHDATAYYFSFASDRWEMALEIEADRMSGLALEPTEVDSERDVILEELAMVRDDPWDALVEDVRRKLFGDHPYGRSVLGDRASLASTGPTELEAFHRSFYRPHNAVLVVAGDTPSDALVRIERRLGSVVAGSAPAVPRAAPIEPGPVRRVERRRGDVARLLWASPVPAATDEAFSALRMLAVILGSGRTSRLHRDLVDERALCAWVGVEVGETVEPGMLTVAAEVIPGVEPRRVEDRVLAGLTALRREPIRQAELDRARRVLAADWIFGHERIQQQALTVAWSAALFSPEFSSLQIESALDCSADRLVRIADDYLDPGRGSVIGWSLPRSDAR